MQKTDRRGCMRPMVIGVVLVLILGVVLLSWGVGIYNGCIEVEEDVNRQWAQVENIYQSRMDKAGTLVATVKKATKHEEKVLLGVVEARAKATQVTVDPTNMSDASKAEFLQAQEQVGSSLSRLLMTIERYPEIRALDEVRDVRAELMGVENRIAVERHRYNEKVMAYNVYVRKFPNRLLSGMFGFGQKESFQAREGADQAPVIDFEED